MRRTIIWIIPAVVLASIIGIAAWRELRPGREPLPVLATVPDFSLTERDGDSLGIADLRGNLWVADFIFTRCGGTCPIMTTNMGEIQQALLQRGYGDVKLVSFTVDPQYDTPEVLRTYAEGYGARAGVWYFITGPGEAIQSLATKGFHLSAATGEAGTDDGIVHSIRFVLVDRLGQIRAYYEGTDDGVIPHLLEDIKYLRAAEHS